MKRSRLFAPTFKQNESEAPCKSLELASRSGLVYRMGSGLYSYTPVGYRVIANIESLVREEMVGTGAQEMLAPSLQPRELWDETGRWEIYKKEMFTLKDSDQKDHCLAPTCEEGVCDLVRGCNVKSYKQLPLTLFQFSHKFRNESVRQGLLRTKEFIMKDAYSFNLGEADLDASYDSMRAAYQRIFDSCNLDYVIKAADPGEMGGGGSEEFYALTEIGDSKVLACPEKKCRFGADEAANLAKCAKCDSPLEAKKAVEIGHIFKLGQRYSKPMKLDYMDEVGQMRTMEMGCYGVGVSRIMQVIIEQNNDKSGIIWPERIAPFKEVIIPTSMKDPKFLDKALEIYSNLTDGGIEPLLDDRDITAGMKFAEANLMGIPRKLIIGPKSLQNGQLEVEFRDGRKEFLPLEEVEKKYLDTFYKARKVA